MSDSSEQEIAGHLFRHEAGALVASLTRLLGSQHLQLAEDVVQETFLRASRDWAFHGFPKNPAGWLRRVARNLAVDALRHQRTSLRLLEENAGLLRNEWTLGSTVDAALQEMTAAENLLRMLFACCHPQLADDQQVALALKTVCCLSVREIARAFVTTEETIQKRLFRAREMFRNIGRIDLPSEGERRERADNVNRIIYLMFNEGYFSTEADELIREDLLQEAIRLGTLLAGDSRTVTADTHALLALMLFHAARSEARIDSRGEIVLLPDQDRQRWDRRLITLASSHLAQAATGREISTYQLEAGIAALHATSPSWQSTDWPAIVDLYDLLIVGKPSPIVHVSRAIAIAELHGAVAGLHELGLTHATANVLAVYHSARAELLARVGRVTEAEVALRTALDRTRSSAEIAFLHRKLASLQSTNV